MAGARAAINDCFKTTASYQRLVLPEELLEPGVTVLEPPLPELVPDEPVAGEEPDVLPEPMPELAPLLVPLLPELLSDELLPDEVLGLAPGPVVLLPAAPVPLLEPLLPGGTLEGDDGEVEDGEEELPMPLVPLPALLPELPVVLLSEAPLDDEGAVELPVLSAFGFARVCLRALLFLVVAFFAGFSVPAAVLSLASAPELVAPCCCRIRISSARCSMACARAGSVLSLMPLPVPLWAQLAAANPIIETSTANRDFFMVIFSI